MRECVVSTGHINSFVIPADIPFEGEMCLMVPAADLFLGMLRVC